MKRSDLTLRSTLGSLGATMVAAIAAPALFQQGRYPNRPIKIIVPWAAGGGSITWTSAATRTSTPESSTVGDSTSEPPR